mgnify:CR=1 FL=1
MPVWHYSYKVRDESKVAKAVIRDVDVSVKDMRELVNAIKGMKLLKAIDFLKRVIELKEPIPFKRYKGKIAHKRGMADKWKWPSGRYPVKAAKYVLKLLENVRNNAENKGLDLDRLVIVHIAAHKGITLKRWMPRAFGRATPRFDRRSNVEVVVEEV